MMNQEISQSQWGAFFDEFSRRHLGQPVTVEVISGSEGNQIIASDLPLVGVVADTKSSEGEVLEIIAGESDRQNVVHAVQHPLHVRLARTDDGEDAALELESADQPKTLLHFGAPETAAQALG